MEETIVNIQIFGTKKCNDTKKAERFFKERGIKYQFIDMKEKGMSKGEFNSVAQANGGLENMVNWDGKDKDLLALIKYITDEDKKEYKYLSNGNMMDGQYGWPLVTGVPFVLYYNEDILNALGEKAPETWDDFARICQEATKDTDGDGKVDQYGFACGMNTSDIGAMQILNAYYYSALWQNGGQVYNDDLKSVSFADEAGKEAVTWLKGLTSYMNEDFMSLSWSDAFSNVFGAGKAAFGITRSSQTDGTTFAETYPNLNWNFEEQRLWNIWSNRLSDTDVCM